MNLRGAYLSRHVADDTGVVMLRSWLDQGSLLNGQDCARTGHSGKSFDDLVGCGEQHGWYGEA